jgi:hypothetical protein
MKCRLYYLRCDNCFAPCGTAREPLAATSAGARKVAKGKRWSHVPRRTPAEGGSPGKDYCPTCSRTEGA